MSGGAGGEGRYVDNRLLPVMRDAVTTVQMILFQVLRESLRERQPGIVWKSARSEYAVDDAAMHRWYRQRVEADTWPPSGPQRDWIEE